MSDEQENGVEEEVASVDREAAGEPVVEDATPDSDEANEREEAIEPAEPVETIERDPVRSPAMDWAVAFTKRPQLGHAQIAGRVIKGAEVYKQLRAAFGDRLVDHGVIHYTAEQYLVPNADQWDDLLDETLDLDPRLQGATWLRGDLGWSLRFKLLQRAAQSKATDPDSGMVPVACGVLADLPVGGGRACLNVVLSNDKADKIKVSIIDPTNGRMRPVDGSDRDITIIYI